MSRVAKGADCKSAGLRLRRFESYLSHHASPSGYAWRGQARPKGAACPAAGPSRRRQRNMELVPASFAVPEALETEHFRIRKLTFRDATSTTRR